MPALLHRHRLVFAALALSAIAHAAIIAGLPAPPAPPLEVDLDAPAYTATLGAAPAVTPSAAPAPPQPRRARAKASPPRASETIASLPPMDGAPATEPPPLAEMPAAREAPDPLAVEDSTPAPEKLALAVPATPVPALEPPRFPGEALPTQLEIAYELRSPFADGRAQYAWKRDGDRYEIAGHLEATGFFAVFLEGQITQESRGTVTAEGLRPERFVERTPRKADEGLAFDWQKGLVTFESRGESREGPLVPNTVDWLSMIFQLAHKPPMGERVDLRVFTQRKMYTFSLAVVGEETVDVPLGRVRTLHLRHEGKTPVESVDVWLGIDQHYLPVKLRYPVARNRFQVEQLATSVKGTR